MGLDMYLYTNSKKVCKAANVASNGDWWHVPRGIAMYWRKANAIHQWFVEHVQYDNDDCGIYDVSVEKLKELRNDCKKVLNSTRLVEETVVEPYGDAAFPIRRVLKNTSVAEELLPTQSGFFFGGTSYDEYYYDELKRTVDGIDAILRNIEPYDQHSVADIVWKSWREKGEKDEWDVTFQYHSSW